MNSTVTKFTKETQKLCNVTKLQLLLTSCNIQMQTVPSLFSSLHHPNRVRVVSKG
ncbi:hypothetical protein JHK82_028735 [Glycine max]|nr:hypothetical protein JHK87_028650 [Glycine soja]KAG5004719.1 hypothetical protein JHK86_028858 [Glycine max]KAG5127900.1 hypothetical protein JHK82_028735 [Glycine max]KAG5152514.1 hypothetical protein JHK84_028986 [Glycine max]KHN37825.1 hypothetical protein glysoja_016949 [Glycine soja]